MALNIPQLPADDDHSSRMGFLIIRMRYMRRLRSEGLSYEDIADAVSLSSSRPGADVARELLADLDEAGWPEPFGAPKDN